MPNGARQDAEFAQRSPSPLTLLTRRRLAYRNSNPDFDERDAFQVVRRSTEYAHYLYGKPPDIEDTVVVLSDEANSVGCFSEETCRGKMVQTFSIDGLTPENSDDEPMLDELVELAGYDTSSPYQEDDPHCCSPFPSVPRFCMNASNPYESEYGLASESSDDESTISESSADAVRAFSLERRKKEMSFKPESDGASLSEQCALDDHLLRTHSSQCGTAACSSAGHSASQMFDSQDSGFGSGEVQAGDPDLCLICASEPCSGCIIHGEIAHNATCFACARRLWRCGKACPICRCPIDCVVKLYRH